MKIPIPESLRQKIIELNSLAERYPDIIPLPEVARFMKISPEGLRAYLDNDSVSFGMTWHKMGAVNKAYKIPTVRFYAWYRNGLGM
ncbi:hypothetical protein [Clostridium sp. MSTE9]|uniref:hypothetical protein n=1 Tax=Clostridium sp. (strain MSTE9) TaxID=1105031 RepID=UPI00054E8E8F|nr:hypothetical protein [Clostridium sp. MSTE9]